MSRPSIRTPIILGISWFFISFTLSEIVYRAADLSYEIGLQPPDFVYNISDNIAWPAPIIYSAFRTKKVEEILITLKNQETANTELLDQHLSEIQFSGGYVSGKILDYIYTTGNDPEPSRLTIYLIYGISCLFSGLLVTILSFSIFNTLYKNKGADNMDILTSRDLHNDVKIRSILTAVFIHLILAVSTAGISLIILLITGSITSTLCKKEIEKAKSNSNSFKKIQPFSYFGEVFGEFQHVFYHDKTLDKQLYEAIEKGLNTKTPINSLKAIKIRDVDKNLKAPDERVFIKADSSCTSRGTNITLILNQSSFGSMQSIQWRVLAGGYVDRNKKFNMIAYSPFTFFFWIIPYLKHEHDLLPGIRTIYTGSYNSMDISTQIRCLHEAVFDAMIEELENNGIDTSELKAQKMQVMNINVSGGKVSMGNVVQGAMNKVTSAAKGVKA